MTDFLDTTVDKFTFRVPTDRFYTDDHLWVKWEEGLVRIGLSDYLQQSSGDVAFAEVNAQGTAVTAGELLGTVETIKTNVEIPAPVSGTIKEVNPRLEDSPELVNQDPYGEGWLAVIAPTDWEAAKAKLLTPQRYFEMMKTEAEEEASRL